MKSLREEIKELIEKDITKENVDEITEKILKIYRKKSPYVLQGLLK